MRSLNTVSSSVLRAPFERGVALQALVAHVAVAQVIDAVDQRGRQALLRDVRLHDLLAQHRIRVPRGEQAVEHGGRVERGRQQELLARRRDDVGIGQRPHAARRAVAGIERARVAEVAAADRGRHAGAGRRLPDEAARPAAAARALGQDRVVIVAVIADGRRQAQVRRGAVVQAHEAVFRTRLARALGRHVLARIMHVPAEIGESGTAHEVECTHAGHAAAEAAAAFDRVARVPGGQHGGRAELVAQVRADAPGADVRAVIGRVRIVRQRAERRHGLARTARAGVQEQPFLDGDGRGRSLVAAVAVARVGDVVVAVGKLAPFRARGELQARTGAGDVQAGRRFGDEAAAGLVVGLVARIVRIRFAQLDDGRDLPVRPRCVRQQQCRECKRREPERGAAWPFDRPVDGQISRNDSHTFLRCRGTPWSCYR
ncbi:conserved hypothetical protein [Ricinus communis]|uniref:Uncharacterized protein n=1 Tax=Ricinus communis TaxID=3988 RepID=B9TFN9_RICCO|nr:conserved hypothetical protein [Ricinus communis]